MNLIAQNSTASAIFILALVIASGLYLGRFKVKGVSLDRMYAGAYAGEQIRLNAAVEPSNATERGVRYASSNTAVATVNANGLVTAVSAGQAVITATTHNGNLEPFVEITVTGCASADSLAVKLLLALKT